MLADFSKGKVAPGADLASLSLESMQRADFDLASFMAPADLSFGAILKAHPRLAKELGERELVSTVALLAGLLTLPDLQGNSFRLQVLVHLCTQVCKGPRRPKLSQIIPLFDMLDRNDVGNHEDPAEDLFVELVVGMEANYRIFSGTIEAAGFTTEIFLSALSHSPSSIAPLIMKSVIALLRLSDEVAQRAELPRNIVGFPNPRRRLPSLKTDISEMLRARVTFEYAELAGLAIDPADLKPFIFNREPAATFAAENIGNSTLERFPLLNNGTKLIVANPSAIALTVRRYVIESFLNEGQQDHIEEEIARAFSRRLASERALRVLPPLPLHFQPRKHAYVAELISILDTGRPLQIIAVVDGLNGYAPERMLGRSDDNSLTRDVQAAIEAAWKRFSSEIGYRGGLTLVVGCGWGRSGLAMPKQPSEDWLVEGISAHDFITYGRSENGSGVNLYAMLKAEQMLRKMDINLSNPNGLLNLHAWANKNGGHLIPHERLSSDFVSEEHGSNLQLPINSLLGLRHSTANGWDEHGLVDPNGRFVRIRRHHPTPGFGAERLKPFYVAVTNPFTTETIAVYEGKNAQWWVSCLTSSIRSGEAEQLAEVALLWAERVARTIEAYQPKLTGRWQWSIQFSQQDPTYIEDPNIPPLEEIVSFQVADETAFISISPQFGSAGARATNEAERRFAGVLLESALAMAGIAVDEEVFSSLMNEVVPSDGARQMHGFTVPDDRDFVRDDLPRPRTIGSLADPSSRIGLGWLRRSRSEGDELQGLECIVYLNETVDAVIERITDRLKSFNRSALIITALRLHEAVTYEERRFQRSFRSMYALADDQEKMVQDIGERVSKLNGVTLACRIVVEMALCASSLEGGSTPGEIDLDELMADAAILFHFGGYSDAMKAGVMKQVIKISPVGDVLMNHSFTDKTITPFGIRFQGGRLKNAASRYEDNFSNEIDEIAPVTAPEFESAFLNAWLEEFGFPFEEIKSFLHAFVDIAAEGKAVVAISRSELVSRLTASAGMSAESAQKIIDAFSLSTRSAWKEVPAGFQTHAWQPWRFRRQLSVVTRPLIAIDDDQENFVFAPAMVVDSATKFAMDVYSGLFDDDFFRTAAMRKWVGSTNNKRGHSFNNAVAKRLTDLGWKTRENVKVGTITGQAYEIDLGDIDVFAWHPTDDRVLVAECKDLFMDKTFGEIARRLDKYRGGLDNKGRPDNLEKHKRRVAALRSASQAVSKFTGKAVFTLQPMLIFSQPTPIQFHENQEMEGYLVVTKDDLEEL